ncbi:hypothetical protein PPERSA_07304 [Pseudocohnilembus persalinus]|uniref:JmjC domain-containing protein n=1 Tax=Pseudocohnilembus persalinus TaxID=266149 RepID=A0A0V0Q7D4_PSEPJ|nr:hypothetical protein PPERSA_07304 [Pseudocohnilembus persalinus]|eukprot:KRW98079.1 hypothetical protein PPERSA_07304 [Pseudocohnilembus persalinus]
MQFIVSQQICDDKIITETINNGGWNPDPIFDFLKEFQNSESQVQKIQQEKFKPKKSDVPLIYGPFNREENKLFYPMLDKQWLLNEYADKVVMLSNSITSSYGRSYMTFKEYIQQMEADSKLTQQQILEKEAKNTWYNFGGNDYPFVDKYYTSPLGKNDNVSPTFGLGRSGSGVPFHTHGQVYLELFYGQKAWFFSPPGSNPKFDPNQSTFDWVIKNEHIQEGVIMTIQKPGEIVYIPPEWWHATLNIGEVVFIANFA